MKAEFTANIEVAQEGGYWATCLEVPNANGQGEAIEKAKKSLNEAIVMLTESFDGLLDRITSESRHDEMNWSGPVGKEGW